MANTKITSNVIADNAVGVTQLDLSDGSSGQVLTTNGSGTLSFATVSGTTINNNADNRIITGSGTANTLEGEANLVFDGTNLGIGVTPSSEFHVKGDANTVARIEPSSNTGKATLLVSSSGSGDGGMQYDANVNKMHLFSYGDMSFNVGTGNISGNYPANERMRIDSDGNVGIGTATTDIESLGSNYRQLTIASNTSLYPAMVTYQTPSTTSTSAEVARIHYLNGTNRIGQFLVKPEGGVNNSGFMAWATMNAGSLSERMRIDSSGKTMINATAPIVSCMLTVRGNYNNERGLGIQSTTTGGDLVMFYATAQVGTITSSGGGVNYGSASDYRLKKNIDYTWDATTRLKQLKPARFNFISDETDTLIDGFIAHEVSSIVPTAVSGDKDATETFNNAVISADSQLYEEGVTEEEWIQGKAETPPKYEADTTWASSHTQPKMQMFDQAKLVPLLVKTIQELEARITTLENA